MEELLCELLIGQTDEVNGTRDYTEEDAVSDDVGEEEEPPSPEEIKEVVKKTNNNKTPGNKQITTELFKFV